MTLDHERVSAPHMRLGRDRAGSPSEPGDGRQERAAHERTATTGGVPLSERLALRPGEAARALGVSERTLRKLMRHDGLPYLRLDGCVLIPRGPLEEWLSERVASERRAEALADEILDDLSKTR